MNATKTTRESGYREQGCGHHRRNTHSTAARWRSAAWALWPVVALVAGCSGLKGRVYDTWPEGGTTAGVMGAHIVFKANDGGEAKATHGDVDGEYKIDLSKGWYNVTATAPGYQDYVSPAPAHVAGGGYDRFDIHMEKR